MHTTTRRPAATAPTPRRSSKPKKRPGWWYSSLDKGFCNGTTTDSAQHGTTTPDCTWRVVSVDKIITKRCQDKYFFSFMEQQTPDCFAACGADAHNSSSPCWTNCFYEAALGPDAGKPNGAPRIESATERPVATQEPLEKIAE